MKVLILLWQEILVFIGVVAVGAYLWIRLDRKRREEERSMTPEEIKRKRKLEEVTDNLSMRL